MEREPVQRTAEELRAMARGQYAAMREKPSLFGLTSEECERECAFGMEILEEGLKLARGELLDHVGWMNRHTPDAEGKRMALRVMPFLCGPIGLFALEFAHPSVGVVPYEHVLPLMDGASSRDCLGVTLTRDNVLVQYRRI